MLLVGEDPYRARLRLAELVRALLAGEPGEPRDLATVKGPELGAALGLARHDAISDSPQAIVMSGRSQGLFDAVDERRVVLIEHAEALHDPGALVAEFAPEAALVLLCTEKLPARGRRRARTSAAAGSRQRAQDGAASLDLVGAVEGAGGRVERIARLGPEAVREWIAARARVMGADLVPEAVDALASAVGTDTERIDQELAKLAAYARGEKVAAAGVRALVSGAIEPDVFALTNAVVRRDARTALEVLDRLLADGQAAQQILALLLWQMRVFLFASALKERGDAERMAKAIRTSPGAIERWRAHARGVSRAQVTRAYESLYATDLAIKQGRVDAGDRAASDALVLTLCILDLCGVPGADVRELVVGEPPGTRR